MLIFSPQTRTILCLALMAVAVSAAPRHVRASTLYWDTNGASAGLGSAGGGAALWLSISWATSSSGTNATGPWPNTQPDNDDQAVFMGTAGTVNVNADVYANALTFQTHNYMVASTGGALHLAGTDPTINVSLPAGNNTATISAPILGDNGFTLEGNSLSGGLKFLVLANTSAANPNAFSGTLTIEAGGALRLGGGVAREQIPDNVDLSVAGVIDFVTSGGASDGKQEKVRNVTVSGSIANFSVGNEADFIVNSIAAVSTGSGQGIALNGNNGLVPEPHVPGRLIINGWEDGTGHLTLDNGVARLNATGASAGVGSRILLAGNLYSMGTSQVINNHGGTTPDDHVFANKALDFTSPAHTIDVASGTLTFTSRTAAGPLDVTSTNPGGTILTKTGAGVLLYEHALQSVFSGTNRVEQGTLRLGATERLANEARLEVAGGVFDLQAFSERVGDVLLEGGSIIGSGGATLFGTQFDVRSGVIDVQLGGGLAGLTKSTSGTVQLNGMNTYSDATTVEGGVLLVNGSHTGGGAYTVQAGGTLGGNGSIESPVSIEADGILALGNGVGTFTVNNEVVFDAGSHFAIEIMGSAADKLVAVDLDLSAGESLDVSVLGGPVGTSWLIAEYSGARNGVFDSVTGGYRVDYGTPGKIHLRLAVPGDYNADGTVDAADYVVWRQVLDISVTPGTGADGTGPDGMPDGTVDSLDYDFWRANFGNTEGSGSRADGSATVPEPASQVFIFFVIMLELLFQKRKPRQNHGRGY